MKPTLLISLGLLVTLPTIGAQTGVGTYFSFQTGSASPASSTYSEVVSASTLPGSPDFSRTGTTLQTFDNFVSTFTAFDGSIWVPGKCATWDNGSSDNSWQFTMNTSSVTGMAVRFKYRLNAVKSGGSLVNGLSAFEYKIGTGAFQAVPGASLALTNDQNYNNEWTADLTALTAIENQPSVTLRWSLPDFDQVSTTQLRMDDLQITGVSSVPPSQPRTRYLPVGNYNVLFVSFDDLKANFGSFVTPELAAKMPQPVTPNLDRLAAKGMIFTGAYCQQAVCWVSRTSLLTGCRPDATRNWDDGTKFRDTMPGVITLSQHFVNKGYSAAAYGKIFDTRSAGSNQDAALSWPDGQADIGVSQSNSGTAHNFYEDGHWQAEQAAGTGSGNRRTLFSTDAGVTNHWVSPSRPVNADTDYSDGLVTTEGISKLNNLAANYNSTGTPFFLAVGFKKPHLPFTAPKTYWDLYDPSQIDLEGYTGIKIMPVGTLPFTGAAFEVGSYQDLNGANPVSPEDARRLIHGYLAATSFADYQLGRVLDALDISGTTEKTIIVMWGDHGWELGDHNGFWAKHSCYEQSARSPLIISAPGMAALGTAGVVCASPVELVDIYPTLVDLANLSAPAQPAEFALQGTSLRPLLEDPAQPWKKGAFTQYQRNISGTGIARPGNGMGYSVRTSRYRYTEWWRTQSTINGSGDSLDRHIKLFDTPEHVELYDHLEDPGETINLASAPAYAALVTELSATLSGGNGWASATVDAPAAYPVKYSDWQAAFDFPGIDALTDLASDADPDGDDLVNHLEYKMGSHPLVADRGSVSSGIESEAATDYFAMYFNSVPARTDVSMNAKQSSTLLPGSFSQVGVETDILSSSVGKSRIRSRIVITETESGNFIRLEAEADQAD